VRRTTTGERIVEQIAETTPTLQAESVDSIDLTRALDALPPAQRQVIVLRLVEGLSFREVGKLTGVSLFTAAARYRLAVNRLRRTLGHSRTT
jgi:RNA polymerase sigma-70 factor (ECF subfamily)